jgi:hypothetical protein
LRLMADDYGSFEPERIKHLELIQAVVRRLGNDGFLMKGWALTVAGAFYGFAINKSKWQLAVAALVPTAIFWGLDSYFLRCNVAGDASPAWEADGGSPPAEVVQPRRRGISLALVSEPAPRTSLVACAAWGPETDRRRTRSTSS